MKPSGRCGPRPFPGLFLPLQSFDLGQVQRPLLGALLRVVAREPARPLEAQGLEVPLVFLYVLADMFQVVILGAHQASLSLSLTLPAPAVGAVGAAFLAVERGVGAAAVRAVLHLPAAGFR